ncbi:putative 6-phosphogluconate dehydrogenase [Podospora conica]|nr:putative 6-phosphogluconate dehydrogenase [Schizothecium conicum]
MVTPPSAATPRPTIGIISFGDMGSGIARLLIAHGFPVATNVQGRSPSTIARATASTALLLPTDAALLSTISILLSIVPPSSALSTAQRILSALPARSTPLYYADMNALSPSTTASIALLFASTPTVRFIDGSILGGPPTPPNPTDDDGAPWSRPLLPTSGPHPLSSSGPHGPELCAVLRVKHISPDIGPASALKMCFASLSKGYAAIAVQTVTTARRLGVLSELEASLRELAPAELARMERAVAGVAPKAYRWVREMDEISATHAGDGDGEGVGFAPELIFRGAAEVFRTVAEDTVLGEEKVGERKRGRTAGDVAEAMLEGLRERKRVRGGDGGKGEAEEKEREDGAKEN